MINGISRRFAHYTHRKLSRFRWVALASVKIRNQANMMIGYYLGESSNPGTNGEFRLLDTLAAHCRTFVDVGANVGDWSARIPVGPNRRIILFEPSAQCQTELRRRFAGDGFDIRHAAVSDVLGTARFIEEDHCGEGSALATVMTSVPAARITEVTVTTLDAELTSVPGTIDFLKIDVEGFDARVLQGARELLRKNRIRFIQFEYNSHWLDTRSSLKETVHYLEGLGYRVFLVRSSGLHELQYERWGEFFRYSNFFACHVDDLGVIAGLVGPKL